MVDVNKLFVFKSLLTIPNNVLPLHLKQTFPPIVWTFTESEGDGIETMLPFKKNSALTVLKIYLWQIYTFNFQEFLLYLEIVSISVPLCSLNGCYSPDKMKKGGQIFGGMLIRFLLASQQIFGPSYFSRI